MPRRTLLHVSTAGLVVAAAMTAVTSSTSAASAAPSDAAIASALDLPPGVTATTTSDDAVAVDVSQRRFNDLPSRGTSYAVLSTGVASDLFSTTVPDRQPSTDLGQPGGPDTTTLVLTVDAATSARCLLVDFAMGTEERVHTYTAATASDTVSVRRDGDPTERAQNVGASYIRQDGYTPSPQTYSVNAIGYWHAVGNAADPVVGTAEDPRLPKGSSPFDSFTTRDTAEVPLPAGETSTVRVSVKDQGNSLLDSVALVDNVRLLSSCSTPTLGMTPASGVATGDAVILGHRGVGNVLTLDPVSSTPQVEAYDASVNGWFPGTVEPRFRWYRNKSLGSNNCYQTSLSSWTPIQDADRQSYVPTNLDKGYCLMALETGVKDGYRSETYPTIGSQDWYVTLPIQDGTFDGSTPQISGTAKVGSTLSALTADFSPRQDSFAYQWFADKVALSGQTGTTLLLTSAEAGKTITIKVTGERSGFDDLTVSSAGFGPVELMAMTSAATPRISGSPAPGRAVVAEPGVWDPVPTSFAYQWRLDGQNVPNAVQASFTPKTADLGRALSVQVVGSKAGYAPVSRTSDAVTVGAAPMTGAVPQVTGVPKVGSVLRATVSGWLPTGSTLAYAWKADGISIARASGRSLTVPAEAVGRHITVTVRGTLTGYSSTDRVSAPTGRVAAGTLTSRVPRVVGRAKVGRTVSASVLGWGPTDVRPTYRWLVNGRAVKGTAASRVSWRIPRAARGKRISVRVTGTLPGYSTVTRTSSRTARVVR